MRTAILSQHEQITRSIEVNKDVQVDGDFDSIILAGLGGSGHPGDLLNALGLSRLPLYVHRNYGLPSEYLEHMGLTKPLVFASSYSGNTEETLSAYEEAKDKGYGLIVSSAGGTLEEWSKRDNVPMVKIDFTGMQPRHTLFAAATGIITALTNSGLADDVSAELIRVAGVLEKETSGLEKTGEGLATNIKGKTPVFISSDDLGFAAKNFKIQMNENVKNPAFWNTVPEMNHNEMVGFSKVAEEQGPFHAVMLRHEEDHERNKARLEVTKALYENWGLTVSEINIQGASHLEKIFSAVTIGLWTTFHLATLYGIDPVPVDGVEDFKAKLKEVAG